MISTTAEPADADAWVEAAPFRAHLRHLVSVSQMSPSSIAVLAGISPRLADHLLSGRRGRAVRRISPDTARKLLLVSSTDARAARRRLVPAATTSTHVRRLCAAGWSEEELCSVLVVSTDRLAALRSGTAPACTQLTALAAAAEVSLLLTPLGSVPQRLPRAA